MCTRSISILFNSHRQNPDTILKSFSERFPSVLVVDDCRVRKAGADALYLGIVHSIFLGESNFHFIIIIVISAKHGQMHCSTVTVPRNWILFILFFLESNFHKLHMIRQTFIPVSLKTASHPRFRVKDTLSRCCKF